MQTHIINYNYLQYKNFDGAAEEAAFFELDATNTCSIQSWSCSQVSNSFGYSTATFDGCNYEYTIPSTSVVEPNTLKPTAIDFIGSGWHLDPAWDNLLPEGNFVIKISATLDDGVTTKDVQITVNVAKSADCS